MITCCKPQCYGSTSADLTYTPIKPASGPIRFSLAKNQYSYCLTALWLIRLAELRPSATAFSKNPRRK